MNFPVMECRCGERSRFAVLERTKSINFWFMYILFFTIHLIEIIGYDILYAHKGNNRPQGVGL